jgi:Tfp pilus assembly protein PilF
MDIVAAESYFRQALLSNINNAGAWYNLGFLEANAGNNPEALKDFDEAIRCDAQYADAYVNRGLVAMRTQNAGAAKADFQSAMDLQPQNVHTRLLLGWAKCASGERAAGCIDLAEAKSKAEPGAADLIAQYCR